MSETSLASTNSSPGTTGLMKSLATASVRAVGFVRMDATQLAEARRNPGPVPPGWKPLSSTLLKASDEQTVAGVYAVLTAIAEQEETTAPAEYVGWGAVAASRFLGRSQLVNALRKFHEEAVWGVSPHLIPHYALHSPSGTLSLALGLKGPNLGVGGGSDAALQGFLTAGSWLDAGNLDGVWLVLTGHTPEFVPGPDGKATTESRCEALALALIPEEPGWPRFRIVTDNVTTSRVRVNLADLFGLLRGKPFSAIPATATAIYRPHVAVPPSRTILASDPTMGLRLELVLGDKGG